MEWSLNPIRYWLVTLTNFVLLLQQQILHANHHWRLKDFVAGFVFIFLLWQHTEDPIYHKSRSVGIAHLLYIWWVVLVVLSSRVLASVCEKQLINSLGISPSAWRFLSSCLANNLIRYNSFPAQQVPFSGKRCLVMALTSCYWCLYLAFFPIWI